MPEVKSLYHRPSVDTYFVSMARLVSSRGTCVRRRVGCVLVDEKRHVLATGYNGTASGMSHCFDEPCPGADKPSGVGLDECYAIHAEQNALLQCRDIHSIDTCYCTTAPCITCVKLLLNTSCKRIVFEDEYPDNAGRDLWIKSGRIWSRDVSTLATDTKWLLREYITK